MTYSRADYMSKKCTHREYYAQFVGKYTKELIIDNIGLDALLSSTDEHLNDIPLKKWDALGGYFGGPAGRPFSIAEAVCVNKEAARQLIEEHTK